MTDKTTAKKLHEALAKKFALVASEMIRHGANPGMVTSALVTAAAHFAVLHSTDDYQQPLDDGDIVRLQGWLAAKMRGFAKRTERRWSVH